MVRLTLRLPEQLNSLLEKSARENERSKNAQIVYILRSFLKEPIETSKGIWQGPSTKVHHILIEPEPIEIPERKKKHK